MDRLNYMKETLIDCVQGQIVHLDSVNTKELGEAIDMIKDLAEAIYYCTITEAMGEKDNEKYYNDYKYPPYYDEYRDMDKMKGRMYYGGSNGTQGEWTSVSSGYYGTPTKYPAHGSRDGSYHEREIPLNEMMHDEREGRSWKSRKTYMESKEMHKDKTSQLQELEKYAQELTSDMVEMIQDATPEEKQYLSNRIAALATKIK